MRMFLCITLFIALSGCTEGKAPDGFKAVVPQQIDTSRTGCPDLIGSYLLGSVMQENAVLADWLGVASTGMTFLVFDSLVGSSAYNVRVQAERQYFLTAAKKLQQVQPDEYYRWRKLAAKAINENKESDSDLLREISELGPVFRFKAQLRSYGCSNGWMKILEVEHKIEQDLDSYIGQQDLWVARDQLGNLLLRTDFYRQKPGWTFWAAGGAGMRLINEGQHWHKMQKAPDDLQPRDWTETDLPPIVFTQAPLSKQSSASCQNNAAALVDFNQLIVMHLPAGVFVEKFTPVDEATATPCMQRLNIAFNAANRKSAEEFLNYVRQLPSVTEFELTETRIADQKWHFSFQVLIRLN
ncbi:MAG TPA: hypothetical protein VIZ65_03530 [Cellvibrionaceae bacterium]